VCAVGYRFPTLQTRSDLCVPRNETGRHSFPNSTFMYLLGIYICPRSVQLFGCRIENEVAVSFLGIFVWIFRYSVFAAGLQAYILESLHSLLDVERSTLMAEYMDESGEQCTIVFALIVAQPASECVCRGGGGATPSRFRNNFCKDDSALFFIFLHG
jgi:hypothetical protein